MKKIASISLTVLFLYSTIGFTFATHYCGGKLFGTRIVTDIHHDPCGCPPMKNNKKDDCCKDEINSLKIQDDFVGSSNSSLSFSKSFVSIISFQLFFKIKNLCLKSITSYTPLYSHLSSSSIPIFIQSLRFWLIFILSATVQNWTVVILFLNKKNQ